MLRMIETLVNHEGSFQNTALLGDSADLILKRLYKALAISNLWMWCEPRVPFESISVRDLAIGIADELGKLLSLSPQGLVETFDSTGGTLTGKMATMLQTAWRLPVKGAEGVLFCVSSRNLLADELQRDVFRVLIDAMVELQRGDMPFLLVLVGDEAAMTDCPDAVIRGFFSKTVLC